MMKFIFAYVLFIVVVQGCGYTIVKQVPRPMTQKRISSDYQKLPVDIPIDEVLIGKWTGRIFADHWKGVSDSIYLFNVKRNGTCILRNRYGNYKGTWRIGKYGVPDNFEIIFQGRHSRINRNFKVTTFGRYIVLISSDSQGYNIVKLILHPR